MAPALGPGAIGPSGVRWRGPLSGVRLTASPAAAGVELVATIETEQPIELRTVAAGAAEAHSFARLLDIALAAALDPTPLGSAEIEAHALGIHHVGRFLQREAEERAAEGGPLRRGCAGAGPLMEVAGRIQGRLTRTLPAASLAQFDRPVASRRLQ